MDFIYQTELRMRYERRFGELGQKTTALFEVLREAIMEETLRAGDRLPPTRKLSALYGLSRGAVNIAYEMLAAEGFVRSLAGSGTFVSFVPAALRKTGSRTEPAIPDLSTWAKRLAEVPQRRRGLPFQGPVDSKIDLTPGLMDAQLFPLADWKRVMFAEVRQFAVRHAEDEFASEGHRPLREAIASQLLRERGIAADPQQVMITNGSMQAIALLCMLLLQEGEHVVVENPCYSGILRAVRTAGGVPLPAEIDLEGVVVKPWEARLLFVTPARQFPTGAVLSPDRRRQLIEWASQRGAYIVEDDFDSEFRWGGRPAEPLKTLDREGRVVYMGSFSKTMATDLRIGYAVVPEPLVEPMRRAKFWIEPHPAAIMEQRALARFMAEGGYARHLRAMQRVIGRRLALFRRLLQEAAGDAFTLYPSEAGLQLFARWRGDPAAYARLKREAAARGVVWADGSDYWWHGEAPASALFGFAHLPEERLAEAVRRLGDALLYVRSSDSRSSRASRLPT